MKRTIPEINEKIKKGKVVVLTAEEAVQLVKEKGVKKATAEVDVVTTGTFGPMCSSGAFFNVGHAKPKMKFKKVSFSKPDRHPGRSFTNFSFFSCFNYWVPLMKVKGFINYFWSKAQ